LYRISADTLVLWGERDRLVPPSYASIFHRLIGRSSVVMVAGAGHGLPIEQPAVTADLIERFLAGSSHITDDTADPRPVPR
jgi:pimeloyl-ACP methyl ester carboxylesterase